ncbi:hypothetical protein C5615_32110 [Burkholderia cepacia]|uniref:OmpA-like domain-containing protein n=1 Tax=Burkholderia cepacia TaxID=292 RepID=A0A2S8I9G7_BURCE|nr:OmpA family protein [Burkholderia cepacia]PQP11414.1 hypothetical protein C5615_32110 [Burkholderia cepacia]HDR9510999.1 OmpA family protein [Burkholderia cepacia]
MSYVKLLPTLENLIATPIVNQTPAFLEEKTETVKSSVHALMPNLLGAIAQRATSSFEGRAALFDTLDSSAVDADIAKRKLAGLFSGKHESHELMRTGVSLLKSLFGEDRLSSMYTAATKLTGLRQDSCEALLAMVTPFALGMMKHELIEPDGKIKGDDLGEFLGDQHDTLRGRLSERFLGALGLGSVAVWFDKADPKKDTALPPITTEAGSVDSLASDSTRRRRPWWMWPILVGALALLLAWVLLSGYCSKQSSDQASRAESAGVASSPAAPLPSASPEVSTPTSLASSSSAASTTVASAEPAASSAATQTAAPSAPDAPILTVLFQYGQSRIARTFDAKIKEVQEWARANPSATFEVAGFTDASGDPALNTVLANKRAEAVRHALMMGGIGASRINLVQPDSEPDEQTGDQARRVEVHVKH